MSFVFNILIIILIVFLYVNYFILVIFKRIFLIVFMLFIVLVDLIGCFKLLIFFGVFNEFVLLREV